MEFNYLIHAKRGTYPADPVARFHLGNGAMIHQINAGADLRDKGISQPQTIFLTTCEDKYPKAILCLQKNRVDGILRFSAETPAEYSDVLVRIQVAFCSFYN